MQDYNLMLDKTYTDEDVVNEEFKINCSMGNMGNILGI